MPTWTSLVIHVFCDLTREIDWIVLNHRIASTLDRSRWCAGSMSKELNSVRTTTISECKRCARAQKIQFKDAGRNVCGHTRDQRPTRVQVNHNNHNYMTKHGNERRLRDETMSPRHSTREPGLTPFARKAKRVLWNGLISNCAGNWHWRICPTKKRERQSPARLEIRQLALFLLQDINIFFQETPLVLRSYNNNK